MSDNRVGDWIQTYSGGQFWPMDARVEEVKVIDIAHALSNQCRFTGHTEDFYSVAQHSVILSELVPPVYALSALFHDAAEAYLIDVAKPVKPFLKGYSEAEDKIMRVIAEKIRFAYPLHEVVHNMDMRLLATEASQLLKGGPHEQWGWNWRKFMIPDLYIIPMHPQRARHEFLERLTALLSPSRPEEPGRVSLIERMKKYRRIDVTIPPTSRFMKMAEVWRDEL